MSTSKNVEADAYDLGIGILLADQHHVGRFIQCHEKMLRIKQQTHRRRG